MNITVKKSDADTLTVTIPANRIDDLFYAIDKGYAGKKEAGILDSMDFSSAFLSALEGVMGRD